MWSFICGNGWRTCLFWVMSSYRHWDCDLRISALIFVCNGRRGCWPSLPLCFPITLCVLSLIPSAAFLQPAVCAFSEDRTVFLAHTCNITSKQNIKRYVLWYLHWQYSWPLRGVCRNVLFRQQTWLHVWNFQLQFIPFQQLIFYFPIWDHTTVSVAPVPLPP